ncbi:SET domain-containing protein [Artomyces pyxidatus]|uniref:SET domain-containing protein n=1 Tax=Artomyces pyxidatus TaxID=48021 RepID=A0ACB8T3M6_9AGAM|nr:SET domain-containing protein [Artomyces pyxidatus]
MAHALDRRTIVFCYLDVKEKILARGMQPMQENLSNSGFTMKDVPGAGKGLFATADCPRSTRLICERPIFISPEVIPIVPGEPTGPHGFPTRYSDGILMTMGDDLRAQFFALHNCKSNIPRDFKGTMDTNNLPVGVLPGYNARHGAVFSVMSRINHSCSPNASYRWDEDRFCGEIRAARPIAKGEELTITYTSVLDSRDERQGTLKAKYAFTCVCQACRIPTDQREHSDARRHTLATLQSHVQQHDAIFSAWTTDAALPDDYIVQCYLEYAKTMEEEALSEPMEWALISHALDRKWTR